MSQMDTLFLEKIVGSDGAKALLAAVKRAPLLKSIIIPRVIVSWLNTMGRIGYEGSLPGKDDSYIYLSKTENGKFNGALTIDDKMHTFQEAELIHVAASVGVALNINGEAISESIKNTELTKLGKSIDLMVKSTFIKSVQDYGYKLSKHGEFHVEHTGFSDNPYLVKHTESDKVVANLQKYEVAKKVADLADKKLKKKSAMDSPEQAGEAVPPHAPLEPEPPQLPTKQPGMTKGKNKPMQKPNLVGGQGRKVKISKTEMEKKCVECGEEFFKSERFTGCLCLQALAKSVFVANEPDGYTLNFKPTLDEEAVSTVIENIKG
jgi:hypothetical protein